MSAVLNLMPSAMSAVDTSTSPDLAVSGQLANAGKTIAMESCLMELRRQTPYQTPRLIPLTRYWPKVGA